MFIIQKMLRNSLKMEDMMAEEAKNEKSIEEAFQELNNLLVKMDNEEVSLEDSFKLYQEGVQLVRYCNEKIDKVEKQLIILNEAGEENGV